MILKISTFKIGHFNEIILKGLITISIFYLLFHYRAGGPIESYSQPSLRDLGPYIEGAKAILHGQNPYVPGITRSGTFGSIPLLLLLYFIPESLIMPIFQLLSLLGIALFAKIMFPNITIKEKLLIILLVMWSSPTREMLTTNQLTGFILGLLAVGVKVYRGEIIGQNKSTNIILSSIIFAVSLDLKPQVSFFIFLAFVLHLKSARLCVTTFFVIIIIHIIIDINQNRFLELDYLHLLNSVGKDAVGLEKGDSVSFWPLVYSIINNYKIITYISLILILISSIYLIAISSKKSLHLSILISCLIPSLSTYFHFYDLIPLYLIISYYIIKLIKPVLGFLLLSLFTIPIEIYTSYNSILIIGLTLMIVLFFDFKLDKSLKTYGKILIGLIFSLTIRALNQFLDINSHLLQSLITTECIIISFIYMFKILNIQNDFAALLRRIKVFLQLK